MKVVIIGGGAAGIFAAIAASKNKDNEVIILEKNEKLGKKLFISGKGRCNVTNDCDREDFFKNVVRNPKFLYSSFDLFSNKDLKELIEENGCKLKVERGNRVFPMSDKSSDIIKTLEKILKKQKVQIRLGVEVKNIKKVDSIFKISARNCGGSGPDVFTADKVIIATGGLSYPLTGSTGDGYKFAKSFGIELLDRSPSLVPFSVKEVDDCKAMQGLALKNVGIKIFNEKKPKKVLYSDFGELLFTHFGVSGPVILSASCFVDVFESVLSIDLKPALTYDKLDERLLREMADGKNKKLKSVIATLLPSSMLNVFIDRLEKYYKVGDPMNRRSEPVLDMSVSDVDKELRKSVVNLLKDFRFTLTSKRGYDEAIITRGGIDVKKINPKTMESRKIKGLYFAGEVLDLDAMTGGFNIQIAATTGFASGL